jgi:dihydroorotate dehydrogenase
MTATGVALARTVMGLEFPTPLGLAAGFDRHGEQLPFLEAAGFGFVEVGTVTPHPELPHNFGVEALVANLGRNGAGRFGARRFRLGVSIRAHSATPAGQAVEDYLAGLARVWECADFVTVNLSAPPARRLLEPACDGILRELLVRLKEAQAVFEARSGRWVPLVAKIGLDPSAAELPPAVDHVRRSGFDGLIAAIGPGDRGAEPGPETDAITREHGARSVRSLVTVLHGALPVISVGGIVSPQDAVERLQAGAALVQLYRGFAERGAGLIRDVTRRLAALSL